MTLIDSYWDVLSISVSLCVYTYLSLYVCLCAHTCVYACADSKLNSSDFLWDLTKWHYCGFFFFLAKKLKKKKNVKAIEVRTYPAEADLIPVESRCREKGVFPTCSPVPVGKITPLLGPPDKKVLHPINLFTDTIIRIR